MKIKIKAHGPIKTVIGKDAIEIDLPAGAILKDLLDEIIVDYNKIGFRNLEELINSYMILSGSIIIKPDQVLSEEDEINIFPYIEGG